MGAMEQMAKSLENLKGRQKAYSEKVHALQMIEGWWWDSTQFQPRPDQPTQPQSQAIPFLWKWSDIGPLVHGDLVVNPQWGWHDHGNDGPDDFVFLDVLDIPLLTALATATWEFDYVNVTGDPKKYAQAVQRMHYSPDLYATGGIVPKFVGSARRDHSPMIWYKWSLVREALNRLRQEKGNPYDAVIIEFTNPETGASIGPTMSVCAQLLRPGARTLQHRHNTSTVYVGVEGQGYTIVGGTRLEWGSNDIFVVPSWTWHEHGNASATEDACVYSVSDAPVIEKVGLYREQRKTAAGDVEDTGWVANKFVFK